MRDEPPASNRPHAIAITGASSGLGQSLAVAYAKPGAAIALVARNPARLARTAETCRARGASVETAAIDVADAAELATFLQDFDARYPVELLFAGAGVSAGTGPGGTLEGWAAATAQIRINLLGAINTVEALLPALVRRRYGRVAVVSSVAGWRGLPYCPGYSASKAGIRAYGEGLRALLEPLGVRVTVISPGFFSSPMTDRFKGDHPFLVSLEAATEIVRRGLETRARRVVFPRRLALGLRLADLMPAAMGDALLRRVRFHIEPAEGIAAAASPANPTISG